MKKRYHFGHIQPPSSVPSRFKCKLFVIDLVFVVSVRLALKLNCGFPVSRVWHLFHPPSEQVGARFLSLRCRGPGQAQNATSKFSQILHQLSVASLLVISEVVLFGERAVWYWFRVTRLWA